MVVLIPCWRTDLSLEPLDRVGVAVLFPSSLFAFWEARHLQH